MDVGRTSESFSTQPSGKVTASQSNGTFDASGFRPFAKPFVLLIGAGDSSLDDVVAEIMKQRQVRKSRGKSVNIFGLVDIFPSCRLGRPVVSRCGDYLIDALSPNYAEASSHRPVVYGNPGRFSHTWNDTCGMTLGPEDIVLVAVIGAMEEERSSQTEDRGAWE